MLKLSPTKKSSKPNSNHIVCYNYPLSQKKKSKNLLGVLYYHELAQIKIEKNNIILVTAQYSERQF